LVAIHLTGYSLLRCCAVGVLAWYFFNAVVKVAAQRPMNLGATSAVTRVLSTVILPLMGITFAVFTEGAADEMTRRIDSIEDLLNQEATLLTMLVPKLDVLLEDFPKERARAFGYLGSHVDRLLMTLKHGARWRRDMKTPVGSAEKLFMAVASVENSLGKRHHVNAAEAEHLRVANDLLRDFALCRSKRKTAERTYLPSFYWVTLLCFSFTFCLGYVWAVVGHKDDLHSEQVSILPTNSGSAQGYRGRFHMVDFAWVGSKRLHAMWVLLILSQYLVLEMSVDMQNPYSGQYRVDKYGALSETLDVVLRRKIWDAASRQAAL